MKIRLKKLTFRNFKNLNNVSFDFNDDNTHIVGDNRSGKTTIVNGFVWLLSGKDTLDRKDYEIKTIVNGETMQRAEHSVECAFEINDDGIYNKKLKRLYKEKWQRKKGASEPEMTGHETLFFIDDVPVQAGQYNSIIQGMFGNNMQLLTNPFSFVRLDWKKQRAILEDIAGGSSVQPDAELLLKIKESGTIEMLRKKNQATIKQLNEQIASIPARIEENQRQMTNLPFDEYKQQLAELMDQLKQSESEIENADAIEKANKAIHDQIRKASELEQQAYNDNEKRARDEHAEKNKDLIQKKEELNNVLAKINATNKSISITQADIANIELTLADLRNKIKEINNQVYVESPDEVCSACGQKKPVSERDKDELKLQFMRNKKAQIDKINEKGLATKDMLQDYQNDLASKIQSLAMLQERFNELKYVSDLEIPEYKPEPFISNKELIDSLKAQLVEYEKPDYPAVQSEINKLTALLEKEQANQRIEQRIEDLKQEEKNAGIALQKANQLEFAIANYELSMYTDIQNKVNLCFDNISFRMFTKNINGGIEPTCDALIDGVIFEAANTASQINAGIEICSVLMQHYNTYLPIFVDNKESVFVLKQPKTQLITLEAVEGAALSIKH